MELPHPKKLELAPFARERRARGEHLFRKKIAAERLIADKYFGLELICMGEEFSRA